MMAQYEVMQGPVEHNGARYEEGGIVEMPHDDGIVLQELGILWLLQDDPKSKAKG